MEKNTIIAVVISAAFLMAWYHFFPPARPPVPAPVAQEKQAVKSPAAARSAPQEGSGAPLLSASVPARKAEIRPPSERVLESEDIKFVIDSRGAGIKHWWVKEKEGIVDLVNHQGITEVPVEKWPLGTYPDLNFQEVRSDSRSSLWRAELPTGVVLSKKFLLSDEAAGGIQHSYWLHLDLLLQNPQKKAIAVPDLNVGWQEGLGTVPEERKENLGLTRILAYPSPSKEVAKLETGQYPLSYEWVGMDNRYYLVAMLAEADQFSSVKAEKSKQSPGLVQLAAGSLVLNPGEQKRLQARVYAGPKGYRQLKQWGLKLEHAVDFGYFGFLGKWALRAMNFLFRLTGNYGWAIILLTCVIQVLVFPLSLKSYQSTAAMKRLQPKIQELQKRYKDDPKRMNQEMLSLYKGAGTNPFGGCIPMVLQIPIFWAFFTMLRNAYELRGAPWIIWIRDLSKHDPYYVLPLVMGGGMFLQQKLAGSTGDPTQAKMMMFMPVLFTFMFLKFPSGLVLYWLTNSIISIATQYWFSRRAQAA